MKDNQGRSVVLRNNWCKSCKSAPEPCFRIFVKALLFRSDCNLDGCVGARLRCPVILMVGVTNCYAPNPAPKYIYNHQFSNQFIVIKSQQQALLPG